MGVRDIPIDEARIKRAERAADGAAELRALLTPLQLPWSPAMDKRRPIPPKGKFGPRFRQRKRNPHIAIRQYPQGRWDELPQNWELCELANVAAPLERRAS